MCVCVCEFLSFISEGTSKYLVNAFNLFIGPFIIIIIIIIIIVIAKFSKQF